MRRNRETEMLMSAKEQGFVEYFDPKTISFSIETIFAIWGILLREDQP